MGKDKAKQARDYAIIRIASTGQKGEQNPVPIGVNGKRVSVWRDEIVPLERSFVLALRNAVAPVAEKPKGSSGIQTSRRKITRFVPRFSVEILGWVDKDKYDYIRGLAMERSVTEDEAYGVIDGTIDVSTQAEGEAA